MLEALRFIDQNEEGASPDISVFAHSMELFAGLEQPTGFQSGEDENEGVAVVII